MGQENDGYVCSSKEMLRAYKCRSGDFKRRILYRLYVDNHSALFAVEGRYLRFIKPYELGKKYYNQALVAEGMLKGGTHSEATRAMISHNRKTSNRCQEVVRVHNEHQRTPEARERQSQRLRNSVLHKENLARVQSSEEYKAKQRAGTLAMISTPEWQAWNLQRLKDLTSSEKHKKHLVRLNAKQKLSEERLAQSKRTRLAMKRPDVMKAHSQAQKQRSEREKRKNAMKDLFD